MENDGAKAPVFVVSANLLGLARWLRFLGFSTEIRTDPGKITVFLREHPEAIFLSAGKKQFEHVDTSRSYLLHSNFIEDQLQELNSAFEIFRRMNLLSRCSLCNVPIEPVSKADIKQQVPERVWQSFNQFWRCSRCRRIYWEGGHIERLKEKLRRLGVPVG